MLTFLISLITNAVKHWKAGEKGKFNLSSRQN